MEGTSPSVGARRGFTGEAMDIQKALATIAVAMLALNELQRALDGNDRLKTDLELRTARQELINLREIIKDN
jgi:hypothetical protein